MKGLLTAETHEDLNFGQIYTHPPSKKVGERFKKEKFINNPSTKRGVSHKTNGFFTAHPLFEDVSLSTPSVSTCVRHDEAQAPPYPTPILKHRGWCVDPKWPTMFLFKQLALDIESLPCGLSRDACWKQRQIAGHRVGKHPNISYGALEFPNVIHEVGGEVKCLRHRFAKIGLKGVVHRTCHSPSKRTYPTPSLLAQKSIPSSSLSSTVNR